MVRFDGSVIKQGTRCWIELPEAAAQLLGEPPHYLEGVVAGRSFRGRTELHDKRIILPIGATWLRDNGVQPSQEVACELQLESPLLEELSADIRDAIQTDPQAQAFFESIAPFYRKKYLRWIEGARTPAIRAQRIAEMVECLTNKRLER
jgi:hypothetical protein